MADQQDHEMDATQELPGGMSRRTFIQGVIVASAATSVAALPTPAGAAVAPAAVPVTTALTAEQTGVLATVLNRLIPAEGALPAAGTLGMAGFIDKALGAAPHLRRHVVGVLAALPDAEGLSQLSEEALDDRLHQIEHEQPEAFDLLLQATYTGYYSHPRVLEALGNIESDQEGHLRLDRFDAKALDEVQQRATDV